VEAKYGCSNGGWRAKEVEESFGVGVWKHIRQRLGIFSRFIGFEVGDGMIVAVGIVL
jgi:hypothetical protein